MKKIYLVVLLAIFNFYNTQAQDRISFGVTGGLFYGNANLSTNGADLSPLLDLFDVNEDELEVLNGGGFYVGFLADVKIFGKFHVQPELLYANAAGESLIIVPVMAKYYIADAFNIQVGPQFDYTIDVPEEAKGLVNKLGLSLGVGAGFDINSKISVQTKYSLGLNNRINNEISNATSGVINPSLKTNILQLGVVYKI